VIKRLTSNNILNVTLVLNEQRNTLVELLKISVKDVISSDFNDELFLEFLDAENEVRVVILSLALKQFLNREKMLLRIQ